MRLTVRNILKFVLAHMNVDNYIPEYDYPKEPNREWFYNVVNTLIQKGFQTFIHKMTENRRKALIDSQNLGITVRPVFMKFFKQSQAISTLPGKYHFLTRFSKPSKDHIQIRKLEMKNENEETKEKGFEAFEEIKNMKSKLKDMEEPQKDADNNLEKLSKLNQLSVVVENSEYVNNDMK